MLIELDDSLTALSNKPMSRHVRALEYLADAFLDGNHVLLASIVTARKLAERSDLNERAKAVFSKVQSSRAQNGRLVQDLSYYVRVVSESSVVTSSKRGSQTIITVGIDLFSSRNMSSPTRLICEHLDDAPILEQMGHFFAFRLNMPGLRICTERISGGGSTTAVVYNHCQQNDGFVLCIVDSDRRAPGSSRGDTARAVSNANDNNRPLSHFVELPVREIENTLPPSLLRKALPSSQADEIDRIEEIDATDRVARHYLDLKDGTTLSKIFKLRKPQEKAYWLQGGTVLLKSLDKPNMCACLESERCLKDERCECVINSGFGQIVLPHINRSIFAIRQDLDVHLGRYDEEVWLTVGSNIAAWCCGSPKRFL